jgi:hypothetical protein
MKIASILGLSVMVLVSGLSAVSNGTDNAKVVGTWDLEIYAEGQYFYLTVNLQESEGVLSGTVSEQSGFFTDSPLSEVTFDGEFLSCLASVPSPPDGMILSWWISLKIGDDVAEGSISNADIGLSASMSGKRTKK